MADTLGQVKRQFGAEAVILNTRAVAKGGLFGFGAKGYVEITAARTMADLPPGVRRTRLPRSPGRTDHADGAAKQVSPASPNLAAPPPDAMLSEIGSLKALVSDLVRETRRARSTAVPEELYETYLRLVRNDVADKVAQQLLDDLHDALTPEQLRDPNAVRTQLARGIEAMLPTAGPIRVGRAGETTIIALVGPTGVGKTTTVAKLAANFSLREHRRVGLVTIDTYRIAAVEQLRTYAQIIDVPLEVVTSPEQLRQAVTRMSDREIILIDTAGRSQRDTAKIRELQEFFRAVKPHEVHLVLSGTSGEGVLSESIEQFGGVGVDRVILTKLDEAIGFGVVLTCLDKAKAKLSYVTTGQDVPDDISVGEGKELAELILGSQSPAR